MIRQGKWIHLSIHCSAKFIANEDSVDHTKQFIRNWFGLSAVALLIILTFACSPPDEQNRLPGFIADADTVFIHDLSEPADTINFTADLIYNENEEVIFRSHRGAVAVDDEGQLFISEPNRGIIHIFDHDGAYRGSVGRTGRGPGEFERINEIAVSGNTLHVLDPLSSRIVQFDTETVEVSGQRNIAFSESDTEPRWMIPKQREGLYYRPTNFFVMDDGNYLVISADGGIGMQDNLQHRTYEFSIYDTESERYAAHDLLSFRWTGRVMTHRERSSPIILFDVPFRRSTEFTFTGERLIAGWTEDASLMVYDSRGEPLHALHYPQRNITLRWGDTDSYFRDILVQRDAGERVFRELLDDTPQTWPAFHSLVPDDHGRAWISLFTEDRDQLDWYLIDIETGTIEGLTVRPRDEEILAIKNGYAYVRYLDSDETPRFIRYAISGSTR